MRKKGAKICLLAPAGLLPCLTMPRCATRQLLVVISAKASGAVSGFRNAGEVTLRTLTGAGVTGLGQTAKPKPYPRFQHFNFLTVLTCALDVLEEAASKSRCVIACDGLLKAPVESYMRHSGKTTLHNRAGRVPPYHRIQQLYLDYRNSSDFHTYR